MSHVGGRPMHLQTQGKIERWHRSMKNVVKLENYYLPGDLNLKFGTIFKYVGMNTITIYFLFSFISNFFCLTKIGESSNVHSYLFDSLFVHSFLSNKMASLLYAIAVVLFYISLGYYLFKKKIFIKV